MHESARWLISKGKVEQAVAVLRKIAKTNGKDVPDQVFESFEVMANAQFQKSVAAEGGKSYIIQGVHDTYDTYETNTCCQGCTIVVIGRHLDRTSMQRELSRILS